MTMTSKKLPLWQPSGPDDLDTIQILLYAKEGDWKTWTALAISEKWPEDILERTTRSKPVSLDDVIHICWDSGASTGLIPHNVSVKYTFNMTELVQRSKYKNDFMALIWDMMREINKIFREDEDVIAVIHDTITSADRESLAYWCHPDNMPKSNRGKDDTKRMWGCHLQFHRAYYSYLTRVPKGVTTIFLFHEKNIDTPEEMAINSGSKQKAEAASRQVGGRSVNVVPAMNGNGWHFYTAGSTWQFAIVETPITGKPGKCRKELALTTQNGRATKNRLQTVMKNNTYPLDLKKLISETRSFGKKA